MGFLGFTGLEWVCIYIYIGFIGFTGFIGLTGFVGFLGSIGFIAFMGFLGFGVLGELFARFQKVSDVFNIGPWTLLWLLLDSGSTEVARKILSRPHAVAAGRAFAWVSHAAKFMAGTRAPDTVEDVTFEA